MRTRLLAALAAAVTGYAVVATLATPRWLVHDAPGADVAVQTTAALVTMLAAVIVLARFRQRRGTGDLLLVLAFAQVAVANLLLTAVPLASGAVPSPRAVWTGMLARLAGGLLLTVAALMRPRVLDRPRRPRTDDLAVGAVTAALVAVAWVAATLLPRLGAGAFDPARRLWDSAPAVGVLAVATATAWLVAAAGFVRAHDREPGDELLGWLAVASIAAAGSHAVTAASFLDTYSSYVSGADLLKLASSLLLLGGIVREVRGSWRDRAAAAVADERRRIARDLHDGLAQELAFIATRSRRLARRAGGDDELWAVCSAAERALDESRRAIAALTRDEDEALDVALAHAAEDVAGRLGTAVTLELDERVTVSGETREALLRIAREAITNAARHGAASRVHVRLSADPAVRMRVSDNGRGFDATVPPRPGRLGLTGMRERAAAVGGELTVSSRRPGGTDVEVVLA